MIGGGEGGVGGSEGGVGGEEEAVRAAVAGAAAGRVVTEVAAVTVGAVEALGRWVRWLQRW